MSSIIGLWIAFKNRRKITDILSFGGSPVFTGLIGNMMAKISGASSSIWIQDIWPEAITSTVGLENKIIIKLIESTQEYMWNNSTNLFCQSDSLLEYIKNKYPNKNTYLMYNPSRTVNTKKYKKIIRRANNINIVFAGNIGFAQNLEIILKAITSKSNKNISLFICGDGAARDYLEKKYNDYRVKFYGWLDEKELILVFNKSDFSLITLATTGRQSYILPGKVQTYLEYGMPIIAINSGATNELVKKNNLGIALDTNDNELTSDLIGSLKNINTKKIRKLSINCTLFFNKNFNLSNILSQYTKKVKKHD